MRYIREVSDIHLDFDASRFHQTRSHDPGEPRPECDMDLLWYPEKMEGDEDTCLIISGDLWVERRFISRIHPHTGKSWIAMLSEMFKYVVIVLGNHDYWSQNVSTEPTRVKQEIAKQGLVGKVYLLEADEIVLDQVKFVGGTLWTDYNNGDPLTMFHAPQTMNDYNYIRYGIDYHKVKPENLLGIHVKTRNFIFERAKRDTPEQKVVVVTHMAPSYQSINPRYRTGRGTENHYYYSDLDQQIYDQEEIDLWFHGHCHCVSDYTINKTRVICNPRGYERHEKTGWDPLLRVEV